MYEVKKKLRYDMGEIVVFSLYEGGEMYAKIHNIIEITTITTRTVLNHNTKDSVTVPIGKQIAYEYELLDDENVLYKIKHETISGSAIAVPQKKGFFSKLFNKK